MVSDDVMNPFSCSSGTAKYHRMVRRQLHVRCLLYGRAEVLRYSMQQQ